MLMRTATQVTGQSARQVPIWSGNGNPIADSIELMGVRMSYARNTEIYGEGEPADYLGLTIETVSRTMTQLENDATIGLPSSRRIVLRNRAALGRLDA